MNNFKGYKLGVLSIEGGIECVSKKKFLSSHFLDEENALLACRTSIMHDWFLVREGIDVLL